MSTQPTVPERYSKRDNDFNDNLDGSAPGGSAAAERMRIEDEDGFVGFGDVQNFVGDLVKALHNPVTGATDVLIDVAIPTRPIASEAPDHAPVLTAEGGIAEIALRWTDVPNAEEFALGRSEVMGGPYTAIFEGLALGYDDANVVAGVTYYYVVTPLNRYGAGPESNEADAAIGGAASPLAGLRWELPCTGPSDQPLRCESIPSSTDTTSMGGVGGHTYAVTLRFRGVVETKYYSGGSGSGYFHSGGTPAGNVHRNIYRLSISSPAGVYYLNHSDTEELVCYGLDYEATVAIDAGASVELHADTVDNLILENLDGVGSPILVPGVEPYPDPFDGQFIQMDVVAIDGADPGDDWSQIVYPPIETRLEHAGLDGLGWALGGHTAAGRRVAGFGAALQAREYGLVRTPAPHAAVETDGTGKIPLALLPDPSLWGTPFAGDFLL